MANGCVLWLSVILSNCQSLGYVGHYVHTHGSPINLFSLLTLTAKSVTLFTHSGTDLFHAARHYVSTVGHSSLCGWHSCHAVGLWSLCSCHQCRYQQRNQMRPALGKQHAVLLTN